MVAAGPVSSAFTGPTIDTAGLLRQGQATDRTIEPKFREDNIPISIEPEFDGIFALHEGGETESSDRKPRGATDGYGGLRHMFGGSAILLVFLIFILASDLGALLALAIVFFTVWLVQGFPKGGFKKHVWRRATNIVHSWSNHFGPGAPDDGKLETGNFFNSPYFLRVVGRGKFADENSPASVRYDKSWGGASGGGRGSSERGGGSSGGGGGSYGGGGGSFGGGGASGRW
jgi:uncharacterized membrane protein YgcG